MVRQDQRRSRGNAQALAHRYAFLFQLGDFTHQCIRGNDHAVTDQALYAFTQDAGWNQVQNGLFTVDHQGVTRIVATLVAHYGGSMFGQQIDDLAFASSPHWCPGRRHSYPLHWSSFTQTWLPACCDAETHWASGRTCQRPSC